MIVFHSPIYVMIPRKTKPPKKISLNLNTYMHFHPQQINQARKIYFDSLAPQLKGRKFDNPIKISLILYKPSKRKIDRANFLSIVEKFFCDALVVHGCIEDDNDEFIISTHYSTGGIDKDNPRVEIEVKDRREKGSF